MAQRSRPRVRGYIKLQEANFVELTLQTGSAVGKKQALQRLCGLLRAGYRLTAPMVMKGLLFLSLRDPDAKVRRWAFNTLAQLGVAADVPLIMPALEASRSETDVFEAGLTALAHILPNDQLPPVLAAWDVPMTSSTVLALAQQSSAYEEEISKVHLEIETATVNELRLGTLMVGLQKAPEGLFSRHHPVTEVIGVLNNHDDPIVAQYSFWAAAEHPDLGLSHMRVQPADSPR